MEESGPAAPPGGEAREGRQQEVTRVAAGCAASREQNIPRQKEAARHEGREDAAQRPVSETRVRHPEVFTGEQVRGESVRAGDQRHAALLPQPRRLLRHLLRLHRTQTGRRQAHVTAGRAWV